MQELSYLGKFRVASINMVLGWYSDSKNDSDMQRFSRLVILTNFYILHWYYAFTYNIPVQSNIVSDGVLETWDDSYGHPCEFKYYVYRPGQNECRLHGKVEWIHWPGGRHADSVSDCPYPNGSFSSPADHKKDCSLASRPRAISSICSLPTLPTVPNAMYSTEAAGFVSSHCIILSSSSPSGAAIVSGVDEATGSRKGPTGITLGT